MLKGLSHQLLSLKVLLSHSINYGLGSVLPQLIGFLLIPLYTRYLTPSDYGILEMVTTLTVFLTPLMKMGIPGAVTRFYYEYYKDSALLRNFVTTINRLLNIGAIVLSSFALILLYILGPYLFKGIEFWPFMVLAIIMAGLSANSQLQKKLIQNRLQSRLNLILQVVFSGLNIGLTLLLVVVYGMGALGSILASTIVTIIFYIQALFYLRDDLKGKYDREMAKEAYQYGVGILPHHMANSSGPLITKTLLLTMGSLAILGVYSIALRFVSPLILVCTSLNTVLVPMYNKARKEEDNEALIKLVRQVLFVSFVAFLVFNLFIPPIMKAVLPVEYHEAIPMLPILTLAFVGRTIYHISLVEIFYEKKTRFISIITISGLLCNILICILFVSDFGVYALCWAYAISFMIWAIFAYLYKRKVSDFLPFNKELSWFTAGSVFAGILGFTVISFL